MTTIESKAKIIIEAENRAKPALQQASSQVDKLNKKMKDLEPTFRRMRNVGVIAFAAIAVGVGKAISKARDFEEETNKFNVVFKDVADEAEKMANTLNKSYRLSRLESKRLLSSTGDILTGFGFTGKAALDLSSKVNVLAVDLASFTNAQGGASAVSSALTKALLGERESLKTYGIAIQEADVKAELLAQGMSGLTGEALRQAKAQVTLDIAMRQSRNAIGDTARSVGSLKATQDELNKSLEDLQITIGQRFAPVLNSILQDIIPIVQQTLNWVEQNPVLTKTIIIAVGALAGLATVLGTIGLLLPGIITSVTGLWTVLKANPIILVATWAVWFAGKLKDLVGAIFDVELSWRDVWNGMKNIVASVSDFIVDKIDKIKEALDILTGGRGLKGFLSNVAGGITEIPGVVGEAIGVKESIDVSRPENLANTGGSNISFDFSNSVITDKDSFVRNLKTKLGRDLVLFEQGI